MKPDIRLARIPDWRWISWGPFAISLWSGRHTGYTHAVIYTPWFALEIR